jgi:hypothetical protein
MRIFCFLLVLFPLVARGGEKQTQPAADVKKVQETGRCDISLSIGWFARQDVSVKPGRVVGPDFNLHIEDDIVYGFIRGKVTRFKVKPDHISGSAAGFDLMLHINKSDRVTEIRGLVGSRRVVAQVSDKKVSVSAAASSVVTSSSSLSVLEVRAGYFRGHVGGGSELQFAEMTLKGCDLNVLKNRPDLIVVLFMCWLGA